MKNTRHTKEERPTLSQNFGPKKGEVKEKGPHSPCVHRRESPGECFLDKVDAGTVHLVPDGAADVVAQRPVPADDDGHLSQLLLELVVQDGVDVC